MTVSLIGSPRRTSEEARLDKNRRIKESIKATKAKRKTQTCSTFDLKIVGNKLSSTQREALVRVFLEAKWLWNECIASGDPFSYKPRKNVLVKTKDDTMDEREYRVLGSQMKQSLVKTIRSNIKTLATLKKQGRKTGTVGFTSEVKSLGLPQPETTYRIRGQKARIQNIPGWVRVRGVGQLEGWEQAKAVLTSEADGWHLHVTCYMDKEEHRKRREAKRLAPVKNTIIGLDMGVKTAITCSDGTEYDVMVEETDRLKREQRKLNRKKKGSNNRQRNRMRIRRAYTKQQNRLNDAANKTAAELLRNETIFMQDEQVKAWHRRYGRKIQHSILGRSQKQTDPPRGDRWWCSPSGSRPRNCAPSAGRKTRIPLERRIYKCADCGYTAQETSKPLRPWSGWDNPNIRTKYPWNEGNTSLWRTHRSHTWTICVCSPCVRRSRKP